MKRSLVFLIFILLFTHQQTFLLYAKSQKNSKNSQALSDSKKDTPQTTDKIENDLLPEEDGKSLSANSGNVLHLSLSDCIHMAMRNNPEIKGAQFDVVESEWKLKEAQPRGLPVLNYSYELAPVPKDAEDALSSFFRGDITLLNRLKIGVGFPVTTFGKIKLAQGLAQSGIDASQEKKNQKSSEVVLKIKQLYYGWLLGTEIQNMLSDASTKLKKEIDQREANSGQTDPIELAKLKLGYFDLLKRLGEVQKKLELAQDALRVQMGLSKLIEFNLSDAHLEAMDFEMKDLNWYLEESKRYRPETHLLDIALKAKEAEYRLEKRKLLPNLGIGGFFEMGKTISQVRNVNSTNDFNDPFNFMRAGVGLRLQGDLNFNESSAHIKQKEAEYYKMSVLKDHAEEGLNLELKETYVALKQSKIDLDNAEQAQQTARQLVFMTKSNQDIGVGDKKDYVDALQAFLLMRARYFEAIYNYNVAVATLMSKVGYENE